MNRMLWLMLMNLGAGWTTELPQRGADDFQPLLQVEDLNIDIASLWTPATAGNLAHSSLLQCLKQRFFDCIATPKRKVGVPENDL